MHQGTVLKMMPFGCFVKMDGYERHGLVHISQLAGRRVEKVEDVVSEKDRIYVKVLGVNDGKISLSLKDVDQSSGEDKNPSNDEPSFSRGAGRGNESKDFPKLNSIHKGICKSVRDFGAFVQLPGFFSNGLVHMSQLAKFKVENASEVVTEGDTNVWVKVISLDDDKISLSMKLVDQGTGRDQDPFHEETARAADRKKKFQDSDSRAPIQLSAVFDTVCAKCGVRGHLASGCFGKKGDKKYDLLLDEEDAEAPQDPQVASEEPKAHKSKKDKKSKKEKKKKKDKEKSSSDPIQSIEQAMRLIAKAERRKKKKDKKAKKSKKKKKKGSDSDSSDSD